MVRITSGKCIAHGISTILVFMLGCALIFMVGPYYTYRSYENLHAITCNSSSPSFRFYTTSNLSVCSDLKLCPANSTVRFPAYTKADPETLFFNREVNIVLITVCGFIWMALILSEIMCSKYENGAVNVSNMRSQVTIGVGNILLVPMLAIPYLYRRFRITGECFTTDTMRLWQRIAETQHMDSNLCYYTFIVTVLVTAAGGLLMASLSSERLPERYAKIHTAILTPLLSGGLYFGLVCERLDLFRIVPTDAFTTLSMLFVAANILRFVVMQIVFSSREGAEMVHAQAAAVPILDGGPEAKVDADLVEEEEKTAIN